MIYLKRSDRVLDTALDPLEAVGAVEVLEAPEAREAAEVEVAAEAGVEVAAGVAAAAGPAVQAEVPEPAEAARAAGRSSISQQLLEMSCRSEDLFDLHSLDLKPIS